MKALTLSLGEAGLPVITSYRLGLIMHGLYVKKEYKGESIGIQKGVVEKRDFNKCLKLLLDEGVLDDGRQLPSGVYSLLGNTRWAVEDIVCTIDPFCYVSHLSAMSYHGLTDRIPAKLFISSPTSSDWRGFAIERMKKDLGSEYAVYCDNNMPRLSRVKLNKVSKMDIHCFHSSHLGAYKNVRDRFLRVSTVGRTFLDMLRNPDLCGGINHVLNVFDEYGEQYLRLITDEVEQRGRPIDKVRAGYIFDERLSLTNDVVESWAQYAQRGGSRKLDPSAEYISEWSDKWCLSLNIFEKY